MPWLRHPESADPAVRLLCLPHAGAGAASFTRWLGLFPPYIAAVRVQLPGREDAAAQPPVRRVRDAVAALLPQTAPLLDRPLALYGHSMGALLAYELAHTLTEAGTPPAHLFVSGRRAPDRVAGSAPIHRLPDQAFLAALQDMGGTGGPPAFLRYALPLIRADLELSEEYDYRPRPGLPIPITAFYGTEDPIVDRDDIENWRAHTAAAFTLHVMPGDHFFHQRHRIRIAADISEALR
jgi:medium-chain acyl-[acyl-carrier-protein] hydrolase